MSPTFLQPVELAEKCFLHEVLCWVAFQRLPVASYTLGLVDVRDSYEIGEYEVHSPEGRSPDEVECAVAGIPPDPRLAALEGKRPLLDPEFYECLIHPRDEGDAKAIDELRQERTKAVSLRDALNVWQPVYEQAIELPMSRIFVALKRGELRAQGRLLPRINVDEAFEKLKLNEQDVFDLPVIAIAPSFWSLQGMHFEISAAENTREHYCHIHCRTEDVLRVFPADRREPVPGVEKIGSSYVIPGSGGKPLVTTDRRRGRPAHPWDSFHHEMAALIQVGGLPVKKEAAIQQFQDWFEQKHGVRPSRAALGEKLKPYYDRFVRTDRK